MTAESSTWNIARVWSATTGANTEQLSTLELSRFRGLVMLGPAGYGKSTEAARLADKERRAGASVHECRELAEFAETSTELRQHLAEYSCGANERTVIYLDALDEVMIPERRRWLAIKRWVTEDLSGTGASIRITCRSAVWPSELTQVIGEHVGTESFATADLQPLSDEDIQAAATSQGIAADVFLERLHNSGARSLAAAPLSLRMLLRLHQSDHGLPAALRDLFQKGLELLAADPQCRHEIGTQNRLPPTELLDAAELLACCMILGGRDTVHLGDRPLPNQLSFQDLAGTIDRSQIQAIGLSGLADATAPTSLRFAHRQFAEFLAGRRLGRLRAHQAKAFLAGPDGWRSGVAGPLRETAAFAAMFNPDVARWIAACDPEVIGLSDVADDIRRDATLALLDRFRSGELTAAQLRPDVLELRGLRYERAAADLRPLITARADGCDVQLEFAVDLVRAWKLSSLSAELADLVLDSAAMVPIRVAAGYALRDCGDPTARRRLKPLIAGLPEDCEDQLKGIALQCLWPDHLSIPELLHALTPLRRPWRVGTYQMFLFELDRNGFTATGHPEAGLRWAKGQASDSPATTGAMRRIAMRIAQGALDHLGNPEVARELTALLNGWARHRASPLAWLSEDPLPGLSPAEEHDRAPLHTNRDVRRRLIDLVASDAQSWDDIVTMARGTPGLRKVEDFRWLLDRACDERNGQMARENYLHLARLLPWETSSENVDAWLRVCDNEPVKSILGNQRSVELVSDEAEEIKQRWNMMVGDSQEEDVRPLDPPPSRRVAEALRLAEMKDVRYFRKLCLELTLEPNSTRYEFQRFLTRTHGWQQADSKVRTRIVSAAKDYLSNADVRSEVAEAISPKAIHRDGVMVAIWLLLECDAEWLGRRGGFWWGKWCFYILRQVGPNMPDEPEEQKQDILKLLNEKNPTAVCREMTAIAFNPDEGFGELLSDLLTLLMDLPNSELDENLCAALRAGEIAGPRTRAVAEFVLTRAPGKAIPECQRMLDRVSDATDEAAEHVAVALLHTTARETWTELEGFLRLVPERGRRVMGRVAHRSEARLLASLRPEQVGKLAAFLFELFPPEADRELHGDLVTDDDSARLLRTRAIQHLVDLEDAEAVVALKRLEARFAVRYSWLTLPRSEAERALRLSRWSPFTVGVIADVLGAPDKRLLCCGDDVIDGIECALESYGEALRLDGGESPEDLWNTGRDTAPTPKAEEHVSDKLFGAVSAYFRDCAVAGREVEIHRRQVPISGHGEPGSKVDILVKVPAGGMVSGDAIRVPIEVKLSGNDDARTAIRGQLAERYMPQTGARHGVYVVVWMSLPLPEKLRKSHRPKWKSIEAAREYLRAEAELVSKEKGVHIRTIVIDGSLR